MKRAIKFRVWDKEKKRFVNYQSICFWEDKTVGADDESGQGLNSFEIMQYTGLKDKNGNEIYENDLIKTDYHTTVHEVRFSNGMFEISLEPLATINKDYIEIIGNKFEDPKLLNNK